MAPNPKLTLSGTIDRVDTTKRTKNDYSDKGGAMKVTVLVERPETPKRPQHYYGFQPAKLGLKLPEDHRTWAATDVRGEVERLRALPEPEAVDPEAPKRKQTAAQKKIDEWGQAQGTADYLEGHAGELGEYEEALARHAVLFRDHFSAFAIASALEGEAVSVTLEPDDQALRQILPGFSALAIEAPEAEAAS